MRVTLFTLLVFILGIWSLAFLVSKILHDNMQTMLAAQQPSMVTLVADNINYELGDRLLGLEKAAENIALLGDAHAVQNMLKGNVFLLSQFNAGAYVTGMDGTAIASVPSGIDRIGVNYRDHVASVLKDGRSKISSPAMGKQPKVPVFSMIVAIRDAQGRVIGALVGEIDLSLPNFLDNTFKNSYGKTGYFLLEDPQTRLIVTGTDRRRIMQPLPAAGINALIDRHIQGFDETGTTVNPLGVEVLASAKRVPIAHWFVVAALPTAEAFAPIYTMQQQVLLCALLLSLLTGILIWWMLKRQLAPLLDTAQKLTYLANNNSTLNPLNVSSQDEIGTLIQGVNHLFGKLTQRESALKCSEQHYQLLFDHNPMPMWVFAEDSLKFLMVNDRAVEHYGFSQQEFAQMTLRDIRPQEDIDELEQIVANLSDGMFVGECRHYKKEGTLINVAISAVAIEYAGIPARIALIQDITEQKQADRLDEFRGLILELLATGEALSVVLNAIVLGVEQLHPAMLCSILLLSRDGEHLAQGVAPSLPDFYNAALEGVAIGIGVGSCGTAAFTGERVIVEDIKTHPYWTPYQELANSAGLGSCWSQPIRSSTGSVLGTFAIYHHAAHIPTEADILLIEQSAYLVSIAIEKNAASEALRESEKRLATILDTSKIHLWAFDGTAYTYINKQWFEFTGQNPAKPLTIKRWISVLHPDDVASSTERWRENWETKSEHNNHFRLRRHDGIYRDFMCHAAPIFDENGVFQYFQGFNLDITERKEMEDKIRQLAFYDTLTQLPNRRLLNDRLSLAMATNRCSGRYGALIFLDLDNFKPLNDTHGHVVGDLLLIEAANRLKRCVREMDTVARFGGDEFVLILSELKEDRTESAAKALLVAEKIRNVLAAPYFLTVKHATQADITVEHHCSASIGVALFFNHQGSQDDILKWADRAMYAAKAAGRNSIRFYEG